MSGKVQRETAPSPMTRILPSNAPTRDILSGVEGDRLALDAETMRQLGYRTVDMLVDRLTDESAPPLRRATPAEMRARIAGPPPSEPQAFDELLRRLGDDVLPFASRGEHPGFFAFVPFAGTWPGALGDFIASACNVYAGSWMEGAGPTQLELQVLEWFRDWLGLPESAGGTLLSGGSAANMTALAVARESVVGAMNDRLVAYVSDQAHSSLARSGRVLGFRPDQVRVLPVGDDCRLSPDTLRRAIETDARAKRAPFFVSSNAGATNTGVIDPLPELREVCDAYGLWLHVDAAYGGFAVLTERGRHALDGIGRADSITLDPHKWLYQPYECGCLLVRDRTQLRRAFEMTPAYLHDAIPETDEVNLADLGIQLTRTSRALKVWLSLCAFGLDAFRETIDRCLDLAERARERIDESPALELAVTPFLSVVCFRRRFDCADEDADRRNAALVAELERSGIGFISSTRVGGRYVLRMCILGHATAWEHVDRVLAFLERTEVEAAATAEVYERHPDVARSWLAGAESGVADLDRLPVFHSLEPNELERLARAAELREVVGGETIVAQWDASKDFYVVLAGTVDVSVEGERIRGLGPGDFFGELAALDWGSGFGYPRLATVTAASDVRLLRVPCEVLNELVRSNPDVERAIGRAARERLRVISA
jgi:glutamate/tyrosine decarboxylase-like PLP-dependent enzyme